MELDACAALESAIRLSRDPLQRDAILLDRLMYKSKNQHGKALYFRRLRQVQRFHRMACVRVLLSDSGAGGKAVRHSLMAYCQLACEFLSNLYRVSEVLLGMLSRTHFMPFCMCMVGILSRFAKIHTRLLHLTLVHLRDSSGGHGHDCDGPNAYDLELALAGQQQTEAALLLLDRTFDPQVLFARRSASPAVRTHNTSSSSSSTEVPLPQRTTQDVTSSLSSSISKKKKKKKKKKSKKSSKKKESTFAMLSSSASVPAIDDIDSIFGALQ